jgi:hypothetical protein
MLGSCVDNTDSLGWNGDGDSLPSKLDGDSDSEASDSETPDNISPWAIAVVGTDYQSTSVSIIDRQTHGLFREGIIDSGSAAPGLSMALSGDVVFPQNYNAFNQIVLIDRYPNSVLTFVDPTTFSVIDQLAVGTGFAANPHDFLWLSAHKGYVTRFETNTKPGKHEFDGGDDILIVDPIDFIIKGRIALSEYADKLENSNLQARPDRMALADGLVWVTLNHLSGDFKESGHGAVLAINPSDDRIVHWITSSDVSNCGGIVYASSVESLFVSCSGMLGARGDQQNMDSVIWRIDLHSDTPTEEIWVHKKTDTRRAFGFDLDVVADRWLLVSYFGDLTADISDELVAFDLVTAQEHIVHRAGSAYGLGGVLADTEQNVVYVGDANPVSPGIFVYRIQNGTFTNIDKIDAHPTVGLPPRHIRFY